VHPVHPPWVRPWQQRLDTYFQSKVVNTAKMTVSVHASVKGTNGKWGWEDLNIIYSISLDLLDHADQVAEDHMKQDLENETSSSQSTL
jgi:hypothetical protein